MVEKISGIETFNKENYEELIRRLKHLKETAHSNAQQDISGVLEKIETVIIQLESNEITSLVSCLKQPPNMFQKDVSLLEEKYDAPSKWKNNIIEFDDYLSTDITKKASSKKVLEDSISYFVENNKDLTYEALHSQLASAISDYRYASDEREGARINIQNRLRDPLFKDKVARQDKALKDAEKTLRTKYKSARKALVGKPKKNAEPLSLEEKLKKFSLECISIIDDYRTVINRVDEEGYVSFSGPQAAMMIGLGEGGERIVRATVAKMLNNHTDSRCANLLSGLNIEMSKVIDVVKKRNAKKIEGSNMDFDFVVSAKDSDADLTNLFDKSNILAINAGPEQNDRLKEKYNYIWGTKGQSTTAGSREGKYDSLSTNTILVDVNKDGCGGRMGKGRAFAVAAEQIIETKLLEKRKNQSIKQICIVHSFAGGSGSGMILPVLRMVKRVYPTALIWVLSAAESMHGKAKNDEDNVVYITSDILQAHYNALHHTPKSISENDWNKFASSMKNKLKTLNDDWADIWKHFTDSSSTFDDYDKEIKTRRENLSRLIQSEPKDFGFKKDYNNDDDSLLLLPSHQREGSSSTFQDATRDPSNKGSLKDIWEAWNETREDPGSYLLTNDSKLSSEFSELERRRNDGNEEYSIEFKLNYNALISITKGIDRLDEANYNKELAESKLKPSFGKLQNLDYELIKFGINATKLEENNPEELAELQKKIKIYARNMCEYHQELIDHWELIQLNLVMKNDSLVKHIIVSNKHFDANAGNLVKRENNYEVYNSVLADTYINVVHQLVSKDSLVDEDLDGDNDEVKLKEISGSSEAMDLSDIKRRTGPTSATISLAINDIIQTDGPVRFDVELDYRKISEDTIFKHVFMKLFDERTSPLFDEKLDSQPKIPDVQSVAGLYHNLYYSEDVFLDYSPFECIDLDEYTKTSITNYLTSNAERIQKFYENKVMSSLDTEQKEILQEKGFSGDNFTNIVYWMFMLDPELISYIYDKGENREGFLSMTKGWYDEYENTFNTQSDDYVITKEVRERTIKSMVKSVLPKASKKHHDTMADLLNKFGILNESHFAIFPSAMIFDYAPILLADNSEVTVTADGKQLRIPSEDLEFINPEYPCGK